MNDRDLVKGCLLEKEHCQRELFRRYAGKMLAVCRRYAGDRAEAEDMLQDAFLIVFDKLNTFRHRGSLEGWIRRVVVHSALRSIRARGIRPDNTGLDDLPPCPVEPDVWAHLDEKELLELIAELPEGYRIVFNLHAIEGYSHREIAGQLNIRESTSRSQLAKARRWLQKQWQQRHRLAV